MIPNNKSFCMYAWTGIYVDPSGDVYPCCVANRDGKFGNVKESSLEEIWNSEPYKNTRLIMLEGKEFPKACVECERLEQHGNSVRMHANNKLSKYFDVIKETKSDGSLDFKLRYLDIRFSNLCNFKCRYCGELLSSAWAQENRKVFPQKLPIVLHASDENKNLLNEVISQLPNIDTIYFAGGEPLISPEHYEILEYLVDNNLTNIELWYNSNCSKLNYKNYNIADIWKNFKVYLQASLDSYDERAEYMRHGTNWLNIIENLHTIMEKSPNIDLGVNCVVSAFNVFTITEFLENLIHHNIISKNKCPYVNFYPLGTPSHFHVGVIPSDMLIKSIKKINNFIEKYKFNESLNSNVCTPLENLRDGFLNSIKPLPLEQQIIFKNQVIFRDKIRNENFCKTFPELVDWFDSIDTSSSENKGWSAHGAE